MNRRIAVVVAFLAPVAAILFLTTIPLCPFAIVLHHPCPGCGMTRAVIALFHGDLRGSLHHHPLAILFAPVVLFAGGREALEYVKGTKPKSLPRARSIASTVAYALLGVLLFGVWIARFFGAFGGPEPV